MSTMIQQAHQPTQPERRATQTRKYISTLDMKDGYFAAGLHPDSQHLTSFTSLWGTYSYQVLSQGLISSAAHFQHWVESKLRKHGILLEHAPFEGDGEEDSEESTETTGETASKLQRGNGFVSNYVDDLIVCSDSAEQHKEHLLKLFKILSEEHVYLSPSKCIIGCKYVRYLGAVCGNNMLLSDPDKVRSIVEMPEPKQDQSQIRGFLGMCSFWRRWIPNFSECTTPLTDLLKKDTDVQAAWTEKHSAAVTELKRRLVEHPVLRQPDPSLPFEIVGDACDVAIGSCLGQRYDDELHPVAYCSRSLNKHERNYSTQEKECLAIVYSMQKFRHYILCSHVQVKIMTDHSSRLPCVQTETMD